MKAPDFWRANTHSPWPVILTPASWLYRAADRINRAIQRMDVVGVPVICVGNIVAGGAGKTPVAIALARLFLSEGLQPHFLSRGYGGTLQGPVRVVQDVHQFDDVGDEPLILAQTAPTWVAKDRRQGATAAAAAGADVIIMDDGFQNMTLEKDFSLLVIDGGYGFGNTRLLPAGPLREPIDDGMARADAVIIVGKQTVYSPVKLEIPVFKATLVPVQSSDVVGTEKVVAFAGIGRPPKFFDSLRYAGFDLIESFSFADHHVYKQHEIMKMVEVATRHDAVLMTTRKDFVRLSLEAKMMVTVFDVDLQFEAPEKLRQMLLSAVSKVK